MLQVLLQHLENLRSRTERGQGMVEYALILALVSVAVIVTLTALGPAIDGILQTVLAAL